MIACCTAKCVSLLSELFELISLEVFKNNKTLSNISVNFEEVSMRGEEKSRNFYPYSTGNALALSIIGLFCFCFGLGKGKR